MRKLRVLAALLLAVAAGCGNDPHPATDRATLYLPLAADIKTLDPAVSYTDVEAEIVDPIYPAFFRYHYLHPTPPFVLELCLGAAEPRRRRLPDGGEEWVFPLRDDLRFQDDPCFPGGRGRAVDARDVAYSFQRIADPRVGSPIAGFLADKVVGWDAFAKACAAGGDDTYARGIAGVRVDPKDPHTLRVRLNQPYPQLRYLMAMHFTSPQAREAVARYGPDYARHPVGCGPMRLGEYLPGQRIVLERSPDAAPFRYPAGPSPDSGKRLPLTERVVYPIVLETTTRFTLFQQGYLDMVGVPGADVRNAPVVAGRPSPELVRRGVRVANGRLISVDYLAFNMDDPVWGGDGARSRALRQAVSLAVDADEYIALGMNGMGAPAQWLLPPGVAGHDPGFRNPLRRADLPRAKRLLAEAGYPDGVDSATGAPLTLTFDALSETQGQRDQAALIRRQIERLGVRVDLRLSLNSQFQDRLLKNQHQFMFYGWFADYPDAENFLLLLAGANRTPGPNAANFRDPEYDRLYERMRALDDGPPRRALVARMRERSARACPWIPLDHPRVLLLTHAWLRNATPHPLARGVAPYLGCDTALRAARRASWNRPRPAPLWGLCAALALGALPAVVLVRRHGRRRIRRVPPEEARP